LARESTALGNKQINRGTFYLDDRGSDRKTSGSYYTDSRLVAQLIDSALVPIIENAIHSKETQHDEEVALLDLKVADIACGSGAFLCAALEKMGEYLAIIRMGDEDRPTDEQLREAKRDVLLHCIYGVDLNPMALELAKFSLWITASLPDMPLSFLDHKLKFGNSLIGATSAVLKSGIPIEAYKEVGSDNKETSKWLRDKVKKELSSLAKGGFQSTLDLRVEIVDSTEDIQAYIELLNNEQETPEEVEAAENEYYTIKKHLQHGIEWRLADAWTASFFIEKTDLQKAYPTNETLYNLRNGLPVNEILLKEIEEISSQYHFFHYHLEFPEVFEKGGFDCLLGNPPWEKIQPEEVKFFSGKKQAISDSKGSHRKKLLQQLELDEPTLFLDWQFYKNQIELFSKFIKNSQLYDLVSKGNLNTYGLFLDKSIQITNNASKWGLIVPSGFATDDTYKTIFSYCVEHNLLEKIIDYENRNKLFDAESNLRFVLLTFAKSKITDIIQIKFGVRNPEEILKNNLYELQTSDFLLFNPNTKNCPAFNSQVDVNVTRKIYEKNTVFIYEKDNLEITNEFDIDLYCEGFNMTRSSHLFHTYEELIQKGFTIEGNKFLNSSQTFLPLYESKLIYLMNSRYSTFEGVPEKTRFNTKAQPIYLTQNNPEVPQINIYPRYWVNGAEVDKVLNRWTDKKWLFGFRNICRGLTDYRTGIFSLIPYSAVGNSITLIFPRGKEILKFPLLIANTISIIFDYVLRQKLGGSNLNFFVFKQLAIVPIHKYSKKIEILILDIVSDLSTENHQLNCFSEDYQIPINESIDQKDRSKLFFKLDAIYAHLYGLEKSELDYILETFPIIKRKDIVKYGSFRTKETIMSMFDEYSWVKDEINETLQNN
jgi:hypothetical protein